MSQQDLIQFINRHFDEGKTQDDVRQLARRHNVNDEAYAAALVKVLSKRLTDDAPAKTGVPVSVLGIAAALLLVGGVAVLLGLNGEFAAILGGVLAAAGVAAAIWAFRRAAAGRRG